MNDPILSDFENTNKDYIDGLLKALEDDSESTREKITKYLYETWYTGTSTEALMRAMEDAGEMDDVVILYTLKNGCFRFKTNVKYNLFSRSF
jgi:hypothetical protein